MLWIRVCKKKKKRFLKYFFFFRYRILLQFCPWAGPEAPLQAEQH